MFGHTITEVEEVDPAFEEIVLKPEDRFILIRFGGAEYNPEDETSETSCQMHRVVTPEVFVAIDGIRRSLLSALVENMGAQ